MVFKISAKTPQEKSEATKKANKRSAERLTAELAKAHQSAAVARAKYNALTKLIKDGWAPQSNK